MKFFLTLKAEVNTEQTTDAADLKEQVKEKLAEAADYLGITDPSRVKLTELTVTGGDAPVFEPEADDDPLGISNL